MNIDLTNRIALVAQGNNDIGRAICRQLAESGARVCCLVQANSNLTTSFFRKAGLDVKVYQAEIGDFNNCKTVIGKIEKELGYIDIVVNNAESVCVRPFNAMTAKQWSDCMTANLDGVFNLCRHISQSMSERGFGRIINISSMHSRKGTTGNSAYAASKFAMHGFTMALAQELARKGITVNTVSPGHIKIDGLEDVPVTELNNMVAGIPAARLGKAEEVASLVDYLCSQQAGFITGADIAINGGQYLH